MSLNPEQQKALDQLLSAVPAEFRRPAAGEAALHKPGEPQEGRDSAPDLLQTWLGISGGDVKTRVKALLAEKDRLEGMILDWTEQNPLDAAFEFLTGSAYAFYLAEKEQNPKIHTYIDALYYIATCASVGYADIFAVTQPGRTIAAIVMIVGPAITNKALERPK